MKNTFTKLTLISVAAVGSLFAAQAQNEQPAAPTMQEGHRAPDPQKQVNRLSKKLALTADQQNQILPILTDRQQQVETIMNDTSLTERERRAKLKAVREDSESRLRSVLTDTQRATYDQMKQEARERAKTRRQTTTQ